MTSVCLSKGPAWGDAQFYGEWLLAAAKAQVLWRTALEDQEFATQVERVRIVYEPDFGITATIMLMIPRAHWTSFVLDLQSEDGEDFAMMFSMGFFVQCGRTCRMAIPPLLTLNTLKNAILTFARTRGSRIYPASRTTRHEHVGSGSKGIAGADQCIPRPTG